MVWHLKIVYAPVISQWLGRAVFPAGLAHGVLEVMFPVWLGTFPDISVSHIYLLAQYVELVHTSEGLIDSF